MQGVRVVAISEKQAPSESPLWLAAVSDFGEATNSERDFEQF
jgi:hypothetical protein